MSRESHVCGVCRTVLDWWAPFDGSAGRWQHTIANTPDDGHAAVPVPRREMTDVVSRCDYCGRTVPPVCMYVLADREAIVFVDDDGPLSGAEDDDGLWSACADCAPIVDSNSAVKLTNHVARYFEGARNTSAIRVALHEMYVKHLAQPRLRVDIERESE